MAKGNSPAFLSATARYPSVVSLQIPMKRPNSVSLVYLPPFFPLHHTYIGVLQHPGWLRCNPPRAQPWLFGLCNDTESLGYLDHLFDPEHIMMPLNLYLMSGISFWYFFHQDLPCFPLLNSLRSSFSWTFLPVFIPVVISMLCSHLCKFPKRRHSLAHHTVPPPRIACVNPGISIELMLFNTWDSYREAGIDIAWAALRSCMLYSELPQKLDFPYTYVHTPALIPNTRYNRLLPSVHWKNEDYNLVARNQEWQQSPVTQGISYLHHLPELHHSHFTTVYPRRKERLFGLSLCPCHSC